MIKETLFIAVVLAFLIWIAYEKYFKKDVQESIQELSEDNIKEEKMKNKLLVLFLLGIFLVGISSLVSASGTKSNVISIKTNGYTTQQQPIYLGDNLIENAKWFSNIILREKFPGDGWAQNNPGQIRVFGTNEGRRVSVSVNNIRMYKPVKVDDDYIEISARANVFIYYQLEKNYASQYQGQERTPFKDQKIVLKINKKLETLDITLVEIGKYKETVVLGTFYY